MLIRLLGPFAVDGASARELGGPRQQSVLAFLALRQGDVVTRDHLVDQIWAEPPGRPTSVLQVYVSHLRRLLAGTPATIETVGGGYRLAGPDDLVDARRFESLLATADGLIARRDQAELRRAVDLLGSALGLFRGRVLETFAGQPFAGPASARIEELRLRALGARASAQLALGQHELALPELEAAVEDEPYREGFWELLMLALYRSGRQAEALQAFQRARRLLIDELGVSPGPGLTTLEAAVLRQDPAIASDGAASAGVAHAAVSPGGTANVERSSPAGGIERIGPWPSSGTTFVGRSRELAVVGELVARHRLVTLTGVGGVGKTRLAIETATRTASRLGIPEAIFVDATSARDLDNLLSAFASSLGNNAVAGGMSQLMAELDGRRAIVLVDRGDHAREPLSGLVDQLLRRCDSLRLILTSRQPIGAATERSWEVPPMSLSGPAGEEADAVGLFIERARRFLPDPVPERWRQGAGRLCVRLDGLPLAIEVVAGMAEALTLEDLEERMDGRLRLEAPHRWSDDEIHHTLAAAIDRSYELLDEEEQALFRALGVFAGGFDLAAVEQVCVGGGAGRTPAPLVVASLVARSLIPRPRQTSRRPYLLLETVALFARDRLEARPEEHRAVSERHARHFLALAGEAGNGLLGPRPAEWLARVDELEPDLLTAIAWWRSEGGAAEACRIGTVLGIHHLHRFRLREGRALLRELVGSEPLPPPAERCTALWCLSSLEVMEDDFDAAARDCDLGIATAREAGCERELGYLLARRAEVLRSREGDAVAARRYLDEVGGIAGRLGDRRIEAEMLRLLTVIEWDAADLDAALAAARRWRVSGLRLDDPRIVADATMQLGGLAVALGRYEEGERYYEEVAAFYAGTGDPFETAYSVYCRARAVHQQGRYQAAAELASEALSLFDRLGDTWGRAISHRAAGQAAHALRLFREAEAHLLAALDLVRSLGYPDDLAGTLGAFAALVLDTGDPARASELAAEGLASLDPSTPSRHRGPLLVLLGRAALRAGALDEARVRLEAARLECERSDWALAREQLELALHELSAAEADTATRGEDSRSQATEELEDGTARHQPAP